MHTKSLLLIICYIGVSNILWAQASYYKTPDGTILDSAAYFKLKAATTEKFSKKAATTNNDTSIIRTGDIEEAFTRLYAKGDSIVYKVSWTYQIKNTRRINEDTDFQPLKYMDKEFPFPPLTTLDGKLITINQLKGKPTLINFWFTTCAPCIEEMPVLNSIKNTFKDSVNFIAVTYEQQKKVETFLAKHPYNFKQIADAEKFTNEMKTHSFPINVFLNKNGVVVRIDSGIPFVEDKNKKQVMGSGKDFENTLRKLL
jgi:cytochrome c biogenesis protein CcmG, thiol:disulfide interchange protein DsbE